MFTGPGASESVSGVCRVYSPAVFCLLCPSGWLCTDAHLACRRLCLVTGLIVEVLPRCALIWLWNETWYDFIQNWGPAELSGWRCSMGRALCRSLSAGTEETWLRRAVLPEGRGVGLGISKLSSTILCSFLHMALCLCWGAGEVTGAG